MEATKAPCPLCGGIINIGDMDWKCPACRTLNKHWMSMMNCEWCHFAPHFLNCPHCKEDFDMWLIMGNYKDSSGKTIQESGKRIERPAKNRYKMHNLKFMIACKLEENVKKFFTDEFIERYNNFEFSFPDVLRCVTAHTIIVSPDDRLWMHLWLFAIDAPSEGEQPLGQLAIFFPGTTKDSQKNYAKIDCAINESWR